jgi:NAD(P)H-dependent flavin oxidoreductase YrpB (nitropropane dioxygenase family)
VSHAARVVPPQLHTKACDLLGSELPIVQTGMGWVSGSHLTAATSAAGGFGILAAATMTPEQLRAAVHRVKDHTDQPFGVNFVPTQADLADSAAWVAAQGVRLISFAGPPGAEVIARLHDLGVKVMPTVGARRHAEKMVGMGVDAVIAQGGEGGGHTGTVPTTLLLAQVVEAVGDQVPVFGAGGFHSGQGLVAALAFGAHGIAMGTRFLLTQESRVPDLVKEQYLGAGVTDTVVSTAIDGAPQRVIRTDLVDRLEAGSPVRRLPAAVANAWAFRKETGRSMAGLLREGLAMRKEQGMTWAQFAMAANAPMMTKAAMVDGRLDAGILPTGQNVGVIDELPTVADLLDRIVADAAATLDRLAG